ncbi:MAG: T9SS type A sorting domain-containing protein [Bacteroidota bacterium]
MKRSLCTISTILITVALLTAQEWEQVYSNTNAGIAYDVQATPDGGYIMVGEVDWLTGAIRHYIELVKTDPTGNLEWSQRYKAGQVLYEEGRSVVQTPDGGYLIGGTTTDNDATGIKQMYLVKTNALGEIEWNRTGYEGLDTQEGRDAILTSDGGYLFVGKNIQFDGIDQYGFLMVKTDGQGNEVWSETFFDDGDINDGAEAAIQTADGNFVICGTYKTQTLLLKLSTNGDVLWSETYINSKAEGGFALREMPNGDLVVASLMTGIAGANPSVLRTTADGVKVWQKIVLDPDISFWGQVNDLDLTDDGGYIVTGFAAGPSPGLGGGYLAKLDSNGDTQWTKRLSNNNPVQGNAVRTLSDDCYIVAGGAMPGLFIARICGEETSSVENRSGANAIADIYPNPNRGQVMIDLKENPTQGMSLRIYDALGKLLLEEALVQSQTAVKTACLEGGMYFYQISNRDGVLQTGKIIVQ